MLNPLMKRYLKWVTSMEGNYFNHPHGDNFGK